MMLGQFIGLSVFTWWWTAWCLVSAELIDDMVWTTPVPIDAGRKISTKQNSLFLGQVMETDEVIFDKEVEIKGKPNKTIEHTVYFPEKGKTNTKKINFISVIDTDLWEEGGMPTVTSGGINCTHATIHFKSQLGKNLDFIIVIRGREPI